MTEEGNFWREKERKKRERERDPNNLKGGSINGHNSLIGKGLG